MIHGLSDKYGSVLVHLLEQPDAVFGGNKHGG